MVTKITDFVEERTGLQGLLAGFLDRKTPSNLSYLYTFGSATLMLFMVQAITGVFLSLYYSPSPDHAYDSIKFIMNDVAFGSLIRGIHHWSASAMVVMVSLHALRTFVMGAYKYPRELTWLLGVFLFLLVLGFGFTGYLLPWDEKAYWATVVGTNMAKAVPFVGDFAFRVLRGGEDLGAVTLARFFTAHVFLLPGVMTGLIAAHLFLVVRLGISEPPRRAPKGR
jgi:ubiquinol-cytochrome c reductase cytochrome b subunit